MKRENAIDYFKRDKKSLDMCENNTSAWAFEHSRGIWSIAFDAGFKFERLVSCDEFKQPLWEQEKEHISEWDFKYTYRVSADK